MSKLSEYESNSLEKLQKSIHDGKFSNAGLVQLIELAGGYLNLKTIPEYAKGNKMSYNGVKKFRRVITIFNIKFVIDNE
jgi:hypothetical protein